MRYRQTRPRTRASTLINAIDDRAFTYSWERVQELNAGQIRLSGVHVVKAMKLDGYECNGLTHREMFWKYFRPEGDEIHRDGELHGTGRDKHHQGSRRGAGHRAPQARGGRPCGAGHDTLRSTGHRGLLPSAYPEEETQKYKQMAEEHGLFITGGSDWHGGNSAPEVKHMGITGLGNGDYEILK